MTLQKFQDKWNGKFCDFDKNYGFQCVDIMRQYLVDVLGVSGWALPPVVYAKDLYKKFKPLNGFQRFPNIWNDLNSYPKPGDIVVWDWSWGVTGIAGHVGICTWADGKSLIVFNQNYPTGSASILRKFSFKGVLGWIRPV